MRINLDFEYDKLHLKEVTILIPKYHHNLVSFLTPILGLYGINVKEFINEFELKTKFIDFDIIIPTRVKISKIKTFQIMLKTPYISSILANLSSSSNKLFLSALTVYKLTLLKSIFMNYMVNYQKRVYFSIRKYLFRLLKSPFLTVGNTNLNCSLNSGSFLKLFKNSINNFIHIKNVTAGKFGVFVIFNNVNGAFLNYLKTSLSLFNVSIFKVPAKLLSSVSGSNIFYTNVYAISSVNFSHSVSFLNTLILKNTTSSLFPLFFKFGSNLIPNNFYKKMTLSLSKLGNHLSLIKILYYSLFRGLKLFNYKNKKILFTLNYQISKV